MDKIICIAGPTASGKTDLSVALAEALDGEIVSCDSMQLYRGMDVGTAKPTEAERRGIVHHLLDVADPAEPFSVGRYVAMADPILQDVLRRGKTAIVVGGTGLYMDALMRGQSFAPCPATGAREALEQRADREGTEALLAELRTVDPETAARLHPADRKRILRALEIYYETGETMTEHDRKTRLLPPRYSPRWLGLWYSDRSQLYGRIDRRVDLMLENGLLDEVRRLLDDGVPPTATAMQAIGYKEFAAALRGECTVEEAADAVKQGSRRYAKRQMTWFRRNPDIFWIDRTAFPKNDEVFLQARQQLGDFDSRP